MTAAQALARCYATVFGGESRRQTSPKVCVRCERRKKGMALAVPTRPCVAWLRSRHNLCTGTRKVASVPQMGKIGLSKMAVGKASVAQAFGISTTPLMRPSMGAHDSKR